MNSISVSKRLYLGFGVLLLCICFLGITDIRHKEVVAEDSSRIAYFYIPELVGLIGVETAFEDAYMHMRVYSLTQDPKHYDSFNAAIPLIREKVQALHALANSTEDAGILDSYLGSFEKILAEYLTTTQETHAVVVANNALLHEFAPMADNIESDFMALEELVQQTYATRDDLATPLTVQRAAEQNVVSMQKLVADYEKVQALGILALTQRDVPSVKELMVQSKGIYTAMLAMQDSMTSEGQTLAAAIVTKLQAYEKKAAQLAQSWQDITQLNITRSKIFTEIDKLTVNAIVTVEKNLQKSSSITVATNKSSQKFMLGLITFLVLAGTAFSVYLARSITTPLFKGVSFAQAVASGKLDEDLCVHSTDELGQLATALREMVEALKVNIAKAEQQAEDAKLASAEAAQATMRAQEAQAQAEVAKSQGMNDAAGQLEVIAAEVSSTTHVLTEQVNEAERSMSITSDRITETASAMEEMNATVLEVARSAGDAANISSEARSRADEGAKVVHTMMQRISDVETQAQMLKDDMMQLGSQAEAIGAIMNVISDIADQTNLLALNAAIEAARAGEAGRGFAVVADEVRKLAEKTMQATVEVGTAIAGVQSSVERNMKNVDVSVESVNMTTELANQAGASLEEIVEMVDTTADQVRTIATAAEQQSATSEEINRALTSINEHATETSKAMQEANAAVGHLRESAGNLENIIQSLKTA